MVRAKKDKRDQENAEETTANSRKRSQQPIGICGHLYQPLLQQALHARQPWMSIEKSGVVYS